MRILIAEDSELNFEMLAACLDGHELWWSRDGESSIANLKAEEFHLLLLDLHMPRLDGLSVLRWLRETARGAVMKVIVLTADDRQEVRDEAFALGADAFLTKPLDLKKLSRVIRDATGVDVGCGGSPPEV